MKISSKALQIIGLVAAVGAISASTGALNGAALTTGVWDALVLWFQGMLSSTFVMMLALIALVASVWQLAHGGGYRNLSLVLGILAVALIGPGVLTNIATATLDAPTITSVVHLTAQARAL